MATMPMWPPDREDRWRQLVAAAAAAAAAAAGGRAKAVEEARKGTVKKGERSAAAGEQDRASAATGVWDRADSSGSSRCTHSVPCIHSLRTMHSFTADPWTEWHRTDMTMHIGKMPGDKTKRALEPPQNSQGGAIHHELPAGAPRAGWGFSHVHAQLGSEPVSVGAWGEWH